MSPSKHITGRKGSTVLLFSFLSLEFLTAIKARKKNVATLVYDCIQVVACEEMFTPSL